jgi:hypothetical protein
MGMAAAVEVVAIPSGAESRTRWPLRLGAVGAHGGYLHPRRNLMKYMAIIYGNKALWESFDPEVTGEAITEVNAFNHRYAESGELLGAYGLGDELTAKTVRVRGGVPAVTDGPYLEAKEFVSSFFLLDCASEARALEIVAEYPFASRSAVEVWPVLHEAGAEM